jgi:hypothetical protein
VECMEVLLVWVMFCPLPLLETLISDIASNGGAELLRTVLLASDAALFMCPLDGPALQAKELKAGPIEVDVGILDGDGRPAV